jgi:hypothetical protein
MIGAMLVYPWDEAYIAILHHLEKIKDELNYGDKR